MSFHSIHCDVLLDLYPPAVGAHTHLYTLSLTNTLATCNLLLRLMKSYCRQIKRLSIMLYFAASRMWVLLYWWNNVILRTHWTFVKDVFYAAVLFVLLKYISCYLVLYLMFIPSYDLTVFMCHVGYMLIYAVKSGHTDSKCKMYKTECCTVKYWCKWY